MPDSIVDQIVASALFAPFLSFVGVAIMVLWNRGIEKERMAVAVLAAPTFTLLLVRIGVAWIRSEPKFAWLPADGSVEGLIGLLVGLSALRIVAIVFHAGRHAENEADSRFGGK